MNYQNIENRAQVVLPSQDLQADMTFLEQLGFRLENIYPSDDPAVAIMSGHGLYLQIDRAAVGAAPVIHLLTDHPELIHTGAKEYLAPNGTVFKILPKTYQLQTPLTIHSFEVRRLQENDSWVIGRAGMLYRDLIPNRLGGSIIASHIHIPNGGPVPDVVHYHTIGFQLIFCYRGWVKLVYEDQGPPFILYAGDCVTQPPEIRHQVLEASDNLEVIEIGVPSDHMTSIDHEMTLPTEHFRPKRTFQGQQFCHHLAKEAIWKEWKMSGLQYRNTNIDKATNGVASVHVINFLYPITSTQAIQHDMDILFTFVMKGTLTLKVDGYGENKLQKGDAFVIPPKLDYVYLDCNKEVELLEISLPKSY